MNTRIANTVAVLDRAVEQACLYVALVVFITCPVRAEEQPVTGPMETRHVRLNHTSTMGMTNLWRTMSPGDDAPGTWRARAEAVLLRAGIPPERIDALLEHNIPSLSAPGVTIIPDSGRNALLIRAPAPHLAGLLELVKLLDAPSPQVLIEITAVQISHDDSAGIGVDLGPTDGRGDPNQAYGAIPASATGPAALNYQLISDNVDVFLAALAQAGTVEVLARPQLVTAHDSPGELSFAHRLPIVTGDLAATQVKHLPATTFLMITGHIDPAGYVSLGINMQTGSRVSPVERSDTLPARLSIRHSGRIQLSIRQGQTVCLGGLVSPTISEIETKVWLLGDIPLIGELFKHRRAIGAKSELTIFLTPHIIAAPTEMPGN